MPPFDVIIFSKGGKRLKFGSLFRDANKPTPALYTNSSKSTLLHPESALAMIPERVFVCRQLAAPKVLVLSVTNRCNDSRIYIGLQDCVITIVLSAGTSLPAHPSTE